MGLFTKQIGGLGIYTYSKRIIPLKGLVLYLPLWHAGLSGSPIVSKDSNALSFTVIGATKQVYGRYLDGSDDYLETADNAVLEPTAFTYMIWVNMWGLTTDETYHFIGAKSDGFATKGWGLAIFPDGHIVIYVGSGIAVGSTDSAAGVVVTDEWHLWIATCQSGTQKIYKDLAEVATGTKTFAVDTGASAFRIGDRGDGYGSAKAKIGDVLWYNRILSANERAQIYRGTKWRF